MVLLSLSSLEKEEGNGALHGVSSQVLPVSVVPGAHLVECSVENILERDPVCRQEGEDRECGQSLGAPGQEPVISFQLCSQETQPGHQQTLCALILLLTAPWEGATVIIPTDRWGNRGSGR